jgi:hypothetical protein
MSNDNVYFQAILYRKANQLSDDLKETTGYHAEDLTAHLKWEERCTHWKVIINNRIFDFYKGVGHKNSPPTLDEVLLTLLSEAKSANLSYFDFITDWGLGDTFESMSTYRACHDTLKNLRATGIDINQESERLGL